MTPIHVELTKGELFQGAMAGILRVIHTLRGTHRSPMFNGDVWGNNVEGACGEIAFAKVAGLFWHGNFTLEDRHAADVQSFEVRTRRHPMTPVYELLIRPSDHDTRAYVLVRGRAPSFDVCGWYLGGDAKQHPEWLDTPGGGAPVYLVPDGELRDIHELLGRLVEFRA